MAKLSIKECVSFGWNTFKSRPWIFIRAGLVIFGVQLLVNMLTSLLEIVGGPGSSLEGVVALVTLVISVAVWALMTAGTFNFILKAHDDVKKVTLEDLWVPEYFWKFLLASVAIGLLVLLGLILLIIPGIILALAFFCVQYLVIDQNMGVKASIKQSLELTKGSRWKILGLGIVLFAINIIGFCALIIGLIVTIPLTHLAYAHAYRSLAPKA